MLRPLSWLFSYSRMDWPLKPLIVWRTFHRSNFHLCFVTLQARHFCIGCVCFFSFEAFSLAFVQQCRDFVSKNSTSQEQPHYFDDSQVVKSQTFALLHYEQIDLSLRIYVNHAANSFERMRDNNYFAPDFLSNCTKRKRPCSHWGLSWTLATLAREICFRVRCINSTCWSFGPLVPIHKWSWRRCGSLDLLTSRANFYASS